MVVMGIVVNGKESFKSEAGNLQPEVKHQIDGKGVFNFPPPFSQPPPVIFYDKRTGAFWTAATSPCQPPPVSTVSGFPTATKQVYGHNAAIFNSFQNAPIYIQTPMGMQGVCPTSPEQALDSPVNGQSCYDGYESSGSSRRLSVASGSRSDTPPRSIPENHETYQYMSKLPGAKNSSWSEGTVEDTIQNDSGVNSPRKMIGYGIHCDRMVPVKVNTNQSNATMAPYITNDGTVFDAVEIGERMELVWHGEFEKHFAQFYPHGWQLEPTLEAPDSKDGWKFFKDSAKVRFLCQGCGHGWTSMKGRVMFWFKFNLSTNTGQVKFRLFGQQCQTCKNGMFEHAMWYPEEVIKVIGNLYNRVGQMYYGFYRPPIRVDRRQGKPRQQHNKDLCQACMDGMCTEEWKFS